MTWENAMRKAILLMLFCGSANAGMYSCVDDSGKKVLRSDPCEQNEKQQPIIIKADPSYYVINSTGEKQGVDSYQAKQAPNNGPQSTARKSSASSLPNDMKQRPFEKIMAWANEAPTSEQRDTRIGLAIDALNAEASPPDDPARKMLFDKIMKLANEAHTSEQRGTLTKLAIRALNASAVPPDSLAPSFNPAPAFSIPAPLPIPAPQPSVITSCDSGGCWDNLGNRYNGGAGGTYFGPTGACQDIGGMMQCP
jgi:hypothetical protein